MTNVYQTSTAMSTDLTEEITKLEQELVIAQKIKARPETIQSLKSRLKKNHDQQAEEEQQKDIKFIKSWSNQFLIKQYQQAKEMANELEQKTIGIDLLTISERQLAIENYEVQIKVIEQLEDEGQFRSIPPFIPDEKAEEQVIKALAELTGTEGFMPATKVAERTGYPVSEVRKILGNLYVSKKILRYADETDSWAVSVETRISLGYGQKQTKETKIDKSVTDIVVEAGIAELQENKQDSFANNTPIPIQPENQKRPLMEISDAWLGKAKVKGLIDDFDPPEVIESCHEIFGQDLDEKPPTGS